MSHRIDRSLGTKPFSNHGGKPAAPQRKGFSLKTVLIIMALAVASAALYSTSDCVQGVRCAD